MFPKHIFLASPPVMLRQSSGGGLDDCCHLAPVEGVKAAEGNHTAQKGRSEVQAQAVTVGPRSPLRFPASEPPWCGVRLGVVNTGGPLTPVGVRRSTTGTKQRVQRRLSEPSEADTAFLLTPGSARQPRAPPWGPFGFGGIPWHLCVGLRLEGAPACVPLQVLLSFPSWPGNRWTPGRTSSWY